MIIALFIQCLWRLVAPHAFIRSLSLSRKLKLFQICTQKTGGSIVKLPAEGHTSEKYVTLRIERQHCLIIQCMLLSLLFVVLNKAAQK